MTSIFKGIKPTIFSFFLIKLINGDLKLLFMGIKDVFDTPMGYHVVEREQGMELGQLARNMITEFFRDGDAQVCHVHYRNKGRLGWVPSIDAVKLLRGDDFLRTSTSPFMHFWSRTTEHNGPLEDYLDDVGEVYIQMVSRNGVNGMGIESVSGGCQVGRYGLD